MADAKPAALEGSGFFVDEPQITLDEPLAGLPPDGSRDAPRSTCSPTGGTQSAWACRSTAEGSRSRARRRPGAVLREPRRSADEQSRSGARAIGRRSTSRRSCSGSAASRAPTTTTTRRARTASAPREAPRRQAPACADARRDELAVAAGVMRSRPFSALRLMALRSQDYCGSRRFSSSSQFSTTTIEAVASAWAGSTSGRRGRRAPRPRKRRPRSISPSSCANPPSNSSPRHLDAKAAERQGEHARRHRPVAVLD